MHEFGSVQKAISDIRKMDPLPRNVTIRLGKMRGSAKGFEEMFREYTRGTEIEGIGIRIEHVPAEIRCECGLEGMVKITEHVHFIRCPKCGKIADVVRGNELEIVPSKG